MATKDHGSGAQVETNPANRLGPARYWGQCGCGWYTKMFDTFAAADAEVQNHLRDIEAAR